MSLYECCLTFFIYGFLGWCTEVAYAACREKKFVNRGFLNGPICPIYGVGVTMVICFLDPVKDQLLLLYVTSIVLVTVLEGLTGFALDKIFHNKWWDYSNRPLNIGGYVCLLFSLIWGVACVFVVKVVQPVIYKAMCWLPFLAGVIILSLLGGALLADLYVTASGIIRLNHQLESMEKIASELHEISDQLGENIYERVVGVMEKGEESRQKLEESKLKLEESRQELRERTEAISDSLQEVTEETRERIRALKARYRLLEKKESFVGRRLMKAFPKMKPHRHKEQLDKIRERLLARKAERVDENSLDSDRK
jgi:uncharacterized membrane protein